MKECKLIATLALAIVALASCQKENIGYASDEFETTSVKAVKLAAAPRILNVSFSCVPAHEENGAFVDSKGPQAPSSCCLIEYSNGYKVVVFDGKEVFPSAEQIEKAPLLENIAKMPEYNSASYDGEQWIPAVAEDIFEDGKFSCLRYSSSAPIPRNIRKDTLEEWKAANVWQKEFSTRLDGYTVTVKDGSLVVSCGESTLILE